MHERFLIAVDAADIVKLVEQCRQVNDIPCYPCRVIIAGRRDDFVRQSGKVADKLPLLRRIQLFKFADCAFPRFLAFRLPGGEIDKGRDMPRIEDFENLPFADFSHFNLALYTRKLLPMNSCRGCVNRCAFCNESPYWGKFRSRSAKRIYDEIIYQLSLYPAIDNVWFIDSLINGNMKVMSEMCDYFIASPRKFSWDASALIRKELSNEMLDKMKASGCNSLHYGLESGSNHVLKLMRKGYDRTLAKDVLKRTLDAGIQINVNLIVGFPGETVFDFIETVDMIRQLRQIRNFTFKPPVNTCHLVKGSYVYYHHEEYQVNSNEHNNWFIHDGSNTPAIRKHRQNLLRMFIRMGGQKNILAYTRDYIVLAYIYSSAILNQFYLQYLRFFYFKNIHYALFNSLPPLPSEERRWIYEKMVGGTSSKVPDKPMLYRAFSYLKDKYSSISSEGRKSRLNNKLLEKARVSSKENQFFFSKLYQRQLKDAIYKSDSIAPADRKAKLDFYILKTEKIIAMLPEEYNEFHLYSVLLLKMDMSTILPDLEKYSETYLVQAIIPFIKEFFAEIKQGN